MSTIETFHGLRLDAFQVQTIKALQESRSVLVAAPTGVGKTVIAEWAVEDALESGQQAVYTAPIKALSNQKFRDFCRLYGSENIGIVTGDVSINPGAPVVIMTTEIFRNTIFDNPERLGRVRYCIFDEIHYVNDADRGSVWEESIIFAPLHIKFVCLSATIPNVLEFADWMSQVREEEMAVIQEHKRVVPLNHQIFCQGQHYNLKTLNRLRPRFRDRRRQGGRGHDEMASMKMKTVKDLFSDNKLPALCFCFSRAETEDSARLFRRMNFLRDQEVTAVLQRYDDLVKRYGAEDNDTVKSLRNHVQRGVAWHHAGMLPAVKDIVEQLFCDGHLRLLFATETFALGVNAPACSVIFSGLKKFNGVDVDFLTGGQYMQMAGRAGRRGMDDQGWVTSLLPARDVDNRRLKKLISGKVEAVNSRYRMSYGTLAVLSQRLGPNIMEAVEKSFGYYQAQKRDELGQRTEFSREIIRLKQKILRDHGYLSGDEMTIKGQRASRINGFEIGLTEILALYDPEDLSDQELGALVMAVIFEGRKGTWYRKPRRSHLDFALPLAEALNQFESMERLCRLDHTIKPLDFRFTLPLWRWMEGHPLNDLEAVTGALQGDIVRAFRLYNQALRQMAWAVDDPAWQQRCRHLQHLVYRDEVDARQQLAVGLDLEGQLIGEGGSVILDGQDQPESEMNSE